MEVHVKQNQTAREEQQENRARMLISCPDGPGIVATVYS